MQRRQKGQPATSAPVPPTWPDHDRHIACSRRRIAEKPKTVEQPPASRRDDPAPDGAAALAAILEHLRRAEAEIDSFTEARANEVRQTIDRHMVALEDEVARARKLVEDAGARADRRLRESVVRIAAGHAEMKRRFEAALRKPPAEAKSEARGLLASVGDAVRDSLLNLGGPIDPSGTPSM